MLTIKLHLELWTKVQPRSGSWGKKAASSSWSLPQYQYSDSTALNVMDLNITALVTICANVLSIIRVGDRKKRSISRLSST